MKDNIEMIRNRPDPRMETKPLNLYDKKMDDEEKKFDAHGIKLNNYHNADTRDTSKGIVDNGDFDKRHTPKKKDDEDDDEFVKPNKGFKKLKTLGFNEKKRK